MSRVMKAGDALVIVGYNSVLMSGIVSSNCDAEDMSNPNSIAHCDNGWGISPADCFLVGGVNGKEMYKEGDPIRKKVLNASEKRGYYWKIVLEAKTPNRSKRKRS